MEKANKILAVDDDGSILTLLEETLGEKGYEVVLADNGYTAFQKAKEEDIGLIILDLFIPRIDGVALCQKLKALDGTKDIPSKCACVSTKKTEYTFDKLKDLFKYITDDMEALKLCAQYKNHIEVMNDGAQSWVQRKDGIEEDDIIYDFKEDFGNRDGIYNLFKMLNINAKSV